MIEDRLSAIKKFFRKNRRLPSYSEMLKLFDISSKNAVFKIINKLIDLGFIEKDSKKLSPTKKFFALPLLGIIKAGFPILAEENKDYLTIWRPLIQSIPLFIRSKNYRSMVSYEALLEKSTNLISFFSVEVITV